MPTKCQSKCSVLKQFLPSQQSSGPISVTTAYHMSGLTANLYSDTRSATNKQRGRTELLIYFPGDSQNLVQNAGNVKFVSLMPAFILTINWNA